MPQVSFVQIKPKMLAPSCQISRKFQVFPLGLHPPPSTSHYFFPTPCPRSTLPRREGNVGINPTPKPRDGFCPALSQQVASWCPKVLLLKLVFLRLKDAVDAPCGPTVRSCKGRPTGVPYMVWQIPHPQLHSWPYWVMKAFSGPPCSMGWQCQGSRTLLTVNGCLALMQV